MRYLKYVIPVAVVLLTLLISGALREPPEALPKWQFKQPEKAETADSGGQDDVSDGAEERMTVLVGEEFTLTFEGNETTGFRWMAEYDHDRLEFVKDEYVPHTPAVEGEPMVGVGGTHSFTYRAIEPGEAVLTFFYARPWESVQPEKKVVYTVSIE